MLGKLSQWACASLVLIVSTQSWSSTTELNYCIPVDSVDYNPFKPIVDGKSMAYLLLLKSYISTNSGEPGVLISYEFSPNGKIFTGKMAPDLKWRDGTKVTPFEAAVGIAKTLTFRDLGSRIRVLGTEKINDAGWENRSYSGIEILNDSTFRLTFESDVTNLTGVLREALSTNSRHNRFWPVKVKDVKKGETLVLGKFPQVNSSSGIVFNVHGTNVRVLAESQCQDVDFAVYPESIAKNKNNYTISKSPRPSAISIQVNSNRLNLKERSELISFIRSSFIDLQPHQGITSVPSFFLPGESGYESSVKWPADRKAPNLRGKKIVLAYEIPIFRSVIEPAAKAAHLSIELIPFPYTNKKVDAEIFSSAMIEGRHVMLQDALGPSTPKEFLKNTPLTIKSLEEISKRSAATLPPDLKTLKEFEQNALKEKSLAPVARRFPLAFTKNNSSVCLGWTAEGELSFFPQGQCNAQGSRE